MAQRIPHSAQNAYLFYEFNAYKLECAKFSVQKPKKWNKFHTELFCSVFSCGFWVQKGMHVATQNFPNKIQPPLMVGVNCIDKSSIHSNEASLTQSAALQSTKRLVLVLCKSIWREWMVVRCTQNWNGNASQILFFFFYFIACCGCRTFFTGTFCHKMCVLCSIPIYVSAGWVCSVWLWINSRDVNRI